jgi:uncharacterized membrane protein
VRRREDLSRPRKGLPIGLFYDPDAFGRFSEVIARALGTARFLVFQTVVVVVWIGVNAIVSGLRYDPYPFILLTLALSLQASYAAPLILLAQNRQDERDRAETERDREINNRTQADTEYLARELASVRVALADVVTTDDLRSAVDRVTGALEALHGRLDALEAGPDAGDRPATTRPEPAP